MADLRKADLKLFLQRNQALRERVIITITNEILEPYGTRVQASIRGVPASERLEGYINFRNGIQYGDMDGDGRDEALLIMNSGGTAGAIGMLLLAPAAGGPRLVEMFPGYKLSGRFERGELLVLQPHYAGWEPNCCPSGLRTERFRLKDGVLARTSVEDKGEEQAKVAVTELFYGALSDKRYNDAYGFLSFNFMAANPRIEWERGYSRTEKIDLISTRLQADGTVRARVLATERGANGTRGERRFDVLWTLIYDNGSGKIGREISGWLLDRAKVEVAEPLPGGNELRNSTLTGKLMYPSSGIPPLTIYARNLQSGDVISTSTRQNQSSWAMAVPAGRYVVFAYTLATGDDLAGGYSKFVTCGLKAECPSHALIEIDVPANGTVFDIDVADWYAPPGTFPKRP